MVRLDVEDTVGFSGTRQGMTGAQKAQVKKWLSEFAAKAPFDPRRKHKFRARHGVCTGSDEEFHQMCKEMGLWVIGHPGVLRNGERVYRSSVTCDEMLPERWMLDRNMEIADRSGLVLITPAQKEEVERGSGTWQMIRYIKKMIARRLPYHMKVVFPDGSTATY